MGDDGGALPCEGSVSANVIGVPMGVDDIAHGLAADLCDAGDQPRHGRFVLGVDQEQSVLAHRKPDVEAHISPVITPGHIAAGAAIKANAAYKEAMDFMSTRSRLNEANAA